MIYMCSTAVKQPGINVSRLFEIASKMIPRNASLLTRRLFFAFRTIETEYLVGASVRGRSCTVPAPLGPRIGNRPTIILAGVYFPWDLCVVLSGMLNSCRYTDSVWLAALATTGRGFVVNLWLVCARLDGNRDHGHAERGKGERDGDRQTYIQRVR